MSEGVNIWQRAGDEWTFIAADPRGAGYKYRLRIGIEKVAQYWRAGDFIYPDVMRYWPTSRPGRAD